MRRFLFIACLAAAACGGATSSGEEEAALTRSAAAANTLVFTPGAASSGALVAGAIAQVQYDVARLPGCRGDFNGQPAWSITGHYRIGSAAAGSFEAGGLSPSGGTQPAAIPLAAAGDLEVWFEITNRWGCQAWDSDYGRNFHFTVGKPAALRFNADWSIATEGTLISGQPVTVSYDLARLPRCRQTYNALPTWDVALSYRFDGGAAATTSVTAVDVGVRHAVPVALAVPAGARSLELWFHNTDRAGCSDWDSSFGKNFQFAVR